MITIWWDLNDKNIIIESTYNNHTIHGKKPLNEKNLESAEKFIKDVKEGRISFKNATW